jgi:hypothetical protein
MVRAIGSCETGYTSTRMYGVTSQHSKRHNNIKSASRLDVSTFFCKQNKRGFPAAVNVGMFSIVHDEQKVPLLTEVGYMSEWKSQ